MKGEQQEGQIMGCRDPRGPASLQFLLSHYSLTLRLLVSLLLHEAA